MQPQAGLRIPRVNARQAPSRMGLAEPDLAESAIGGSPKADFGHWRISQAPISGVPAQQVQRKLPNDRRAWFSLPDRG